MSVGGAGTEAPRFSFERADYFVIAIAKNSGECLAFAFNIDGGDELVITPNLPACSIRDCGGDRKVHYIVRCNRVARRLCPDSQADFIIGADIRLAILDAIEIDHRSSVLLQDRLQPCADQQFGGFIRRAPKRWRRGIERRSSGWAKNTPLHR